MSHTTPRGFSPFRSPSGGGAASAAKQNPSAPSASVVSGFGSVMGQEHELQSSTHGSIGRDQGPHAVAVDRILRDQQARLGANVVLLERRNALLPHPARFRALQKAHRPLTKHRRIAMPTECAALLENLAAQHLEILSKIAALMAQGSDELHSTPLLAEVAKSHEEMAWMLTALLTEDDLAHDLLPLPVVGGPGAAPATAAEKNWENEGGAISPGVPPAVDPLGNRRP